MKVHFAEILAQEHASLAAVTDPAGLEDWRRRIVDEVMAPQSLYAKVLRQEGDLHERSAFLDRWRAMIAVAVARVLESGAAARPTIDVQKTALLILAALQGGHVLSRLAQDVAPLNAALDLALAPLVAATDEAAVCTGQNGPLGSMDV